MKMLNKDSFADYKPLKLVKHVAIAHSGIYKYRKCELPSLGLDSESIPEKHKDLDVFSVYRPAVLFMGTADLFTNLPVTVEHPEYLVDQYNCRDLMKGFTGNDADVIMEDGEAYVHSTITLIDKDAIAYYEHNCREVSPGYISHSIWEDGEHNGEQYQIKMTGIDEVNHLALTVRGRGGKTACVRDSMRTISILDWAKLTIDSMNIRDMISNVAKDSTLIPVIRDSLKAIPDSNRKALFDACLEDMENAGTMEPTVIEKAVEKLLQIYDNILDDNCSIYDGGSMKDSEEKEATKDYAPGATGLAGTGTQKQEAEPKPAPVKKPEVKDTETPAEKSATCDEDKVAEEKKEEPVKDSEEKKEEPVKDSEEKKEEPVKDSEDKKEPVKDSDTFGLILAELKGLKELLSSKFTADSAVKEEPKKVEEPKATNDSAIVVDSNSDGMSVEDFMAEMRR